MLMLLFQFPGVFLANHVRRPKAVFMVITIASRLVYLLIALLPLLFPELRGRRLLSFLIVLSAISAAGGNLITPLWFSWMGSVIPRRRTSTYWGRRQVWMQCVWVLTFISMWAYTYWLKPPVTVAFPTLVAVGVLAGVVDILLFRGVHEPLPRERPTLSLRLLLAPLRDAVYRTFILQQGVFSFVTMTSAAFMLVYVLDVLALGLWRAMLIWCAAGAGNAVAAAFWGRIADRFGTRPVIVITTVGKPLIAVVFLLVTPQVATVVLTVSFFFDAMLNAGLTVAANGYMFRHSPPENRSAFTAAITGLAGICGGLGAMAGGWFLHAFEGWSLQAFSRTWTNYHLLFAVGVLLRVGCIPLARQIREPRSARSRVVLYELRDMLPGLLVLLPVALQRLVKGEKAD